MATRFAGYPAPFVHHAPGGKKVQQLIWGDEVEMGAGEQDGWLQVDRARNAFGWMRAEDLQDERLLEFGFVDVGQGDGCVVTVPDGRRTLIDAGQEKNLFAFLRYRFDLWRDPRVIEFDHAVITHSDLDHYGGFQPIFESPHFEFGAVYHNGIMERAETKMFGPEEKKGKITYLTELATTKAKTKALSTVAKGRKKLYPKLLRTALGSGRVGNVRMLSSKDEFIPGFEPAADACAIRVLAPVTERIGNKTCLRRFTSNDGLTKNGHSVVLRFEYRDVRILVGGDLNRPAENYLLNHYTGLDPEPDDEAGFAELVHQGRDHFGADVAKSCHHGSADFNDAFVGAVGAFATVISSGDNEHYAHPRPDTLGAHGRLGRGDRPLIFSTELARSAREFIKRPEALAPAASDALDEAAAADAAGEPSPEEQPGRPVNQYQRSIAVYGMINVRTDGRSVLLAQKLEQRDPHGGEWDYHCLEPSEDGLVYNPEA